MEESIYGIQKEGIVAGDFSFDEYENLPATGIFKDKVLIWWYVDKNGKLTYNDIYEMSDPYFNNAFMGSWTSKQTQKSQQVGWGHFRIPCSGDLDIGAAEFSPNPKYYKYGWDEYRKEMKMKYPDYPY